MKAEKGELDDLDLRDPMPFHYPIDYVIRTWLDHRKHGSYPEAGGYNDQDPLLMDDWHTMNLYHMRVDNNVYSHIEVQEMGQSWGDMMGG